MDEVYGLGIIRRFVSDPIFKECCFNVYNSFQRFSLKEGMLSFLHPPIIRLASASGERLSRLPESGERAGKERRPLPALLSPQALPLFVLFPFPLLLLWVVLLLLLLGFELMLPSLP